jgi:oligosaccharide repeat unit polymerase
MWRKIFTPEILFLIGVSQALFPYLIWLVNGPNPTYSYSITYLPLFIWIIGYCSFLFGSFLSGKGVKSDKVTTFTSNGIVKFNFKFLNKALSVLTILIVIQMCFITLSYGYFPLQEIINGGTTKNIHDINAAADDTGMGQLGLFVNSLFLFNALLLTLIIKSIEEKRKLGWIVIICIFTAIIGTLITGKRQGFFMMIFFVAAGLSVRFNDPVQSIFLSFNIYLTRKRSLIISVFSLAMMVSFLGLFASVRVGSGYEVSALDEISNYLQLPLINFEAQCEQAGFGPISFNPAYTFSLLLPMKVAQNLGYYNSSLAPNYPEITSPAGFYQLIHWGLGIYGVIVLSFVIGMISKYFYNNSFTSLLHLLIYSQITWALFSSYAYNHFLFLVFLPLPCMLLWVFHWIFKLISPPETEKKWM